MWVTKFHTHTKQQEIIVRYNLIFKFLDSKLEDKRICCNQLTHKKKIFKVNKESVLHSILVSSTDGWLCSYLDLVHHMEGDFTTVCFAFTRIFITYTYIQIVSYSIHMGSDTQQWGCLYVPVSWIKKNCLLLQSNEKGRHIHCLTSMFWHTNKICWINILIYNTTPSKGSHNEWACLTQDSCCLLLTPCLWQVEKYFKYAYAGLFSMEGRISIRHR